MLLTRFEWDLTVLSVTVTIAVGGEFGQSETVLVGWVFGTAQWRLARGTEHLFDRVNLTLSEGNVKQTLYAFRIDSNWHSLSSSSLIDYFRK